MSEEWHTYKGVLDERGRQLSEIRDGVTSLNTLVIKLDAKLDGVHDKLSDHKENLNDHENRLRSVEKRQWWFLGIAAVIGTFIGPIFSKAFKFVGAG